MYARAHTHTHTHTVPCTHTLDINRYLSMATKEEEERRECQGRGGGQVTFEQTLEKGVKLQKTQGKYISRVKDNIDFEKLCIRHVGGDCHPHSSVLQTTYFPFKTKLNLQHCKADRGFRDYLILLFLEII